MNDVAKNTNPLVSVIIPLYNHENYVADCIDSIAGQSYRNIEIVLIDDASSDSGFEVAKKKLSTCGRSSIILKNFENKGICSTLNRGVKAASGQYICIIASDDLLALGRIERHVEIMQAQSDPNIIACHGPLQVFDESDGLLGKKGVLPPNAEYSLRSVVTKKFCPTLQGCTFSSEVFEKFNFDEDLFFEDWDFFIRVFLSDHRVLQDAHVSAFYRHHAAGANRQITKMISGRSAIFHKHADEILLQSGDLRKLFEFTIIFSNLKGVSYTGQVVLWFSYLIKIATQHPLEARAHLRTILWCLKNVVRNNKLFMALRR